MLKRFLGQVVRGEDLSEAEMMEALDLVLRGQVRPAQTAAFLVALRLKGETVEEIAGAARAVRRQTPGLEVPDGLVVLDRDEINIDEETVLKTCNLSGGATNTFNVSTATALVAAGGGLRVAKHGARTESLYCGSADVVAALGVNLDLTLTEVERCLKQVGLAFLYAPLFHTPLAHPTKVRTEIGVRTILNLVGPLTNPAGASAQVLGVYLPERTELMARVLQRLEVSEAFVLYGQDTYDEISLSGPTRITHLSGDELRTFELVPEDLGLTRAPVEAIRGGDAVQNAQIIREILDGAPGPKRDVVLVNAAAAFVVAGRARDLKEGLDLARQAIDSGKARAKLEDLVVFTAGCGVYQHKEVG